jgi:Kef-type K+ transport system membrane component KefB
VVDLTPHGRISPNPHLEVRMESLASRSELLIATVMIDIAIILALGTLLGRLVRRWRQPAVIGEILAGIMLGPSLLGLLPGDLDAKIFPSEARPFLAAVAQLGLLLFMFLIGWEVNPRLLDRRRGTAAAVSIGSVALSFGLGVALATVLYGRHHTVASHRVSFVAFALFMGAAMSITAFPVLARILAERGLTGTRVGALALASAAIDDIVAWCLLDLVAAVATARGPEDLVQVLVLLVVYLAVLALVVRPLLAAVVRRCTGTRSAPYLVVVVIGAVFASSYATTWIGLHAIFGAFCLGIIMPREPAEKLRELIQRPLE